MLLHSDEGGSCRSTVTLDASGGTLYRRESFSRQMIDGARMDGPYELEGSKVHLGGIPMISFSPHKSRLMGTTVTSVLELRSKTSFEVVAHPLLKNTNCP